MKTATVKELKTELNYSSQAELIELCLQLSKFKKENKELLTYLLFEKSNEEGFIEDVKIEVDVLFTEINTNSYFYIKKSVRKILRLIKKYIRYSKKKETEIELLLYFCKKLSEFKPSVRKNSVLLGILQREVISVKKKIKVVHEDLQYDYNLELKNLNL
ncbi:hypothetical protein SAMN05444411_102209 [Lutibacter oricola]|uniref:Uncharacterized protein n=1 Tax=Lutibacter oricola TaxID=762486 RepID=A0A1H2WK51_9FLAO|nr:hypothetical protein [Lutibacter oricola]SDW80379.1 hypothetical protein SAMN05444411_102209 [Lutibacter oricola]